MIRLRALSIVLPLVAALAIVAGSGGASASAGAAARPPVTIRMGDFFFRPGVVKVHVGQAVRFVNVGKIVHTVADTNAKGAVRSKLIHPRPLAHGQVQVVRFAKTGTVHYLCTFHPTLMKGRIIVVR
jgi:plastocyanin